MEIDWSLFAKNVFATVIYSVLGLVLFSLAFFVLAKITKFPIRKEIEEDQNIALAIVIGSAILGFAWIVAAAVHGG